MPKEEWGTKRLCPQCATRFYDLNRDPMVCPECGHETSLESLNAGRSRSFVSDKDDRSGKDQRDDVLDDDDLDDDDADADLDDDLLDDDDDDDNVSLDEIADVAKDDDE